MVLRIVKNLKFKVGSRLGLPKYKNNLLKSYTANWSEEVFVIKDLKNTLSLTYNINDLNNKIVGTCYEKELQTINQKNQD